MKPIFARLGKEFLASTVGSVNSLRLPPPKHFIVFTNGRTGSNLLVSLLRSHPEFKLHSEIFGEHQLEDPIVKSWINRIGPVRYFRRAFRRIGSERYVGQKILYYNIDETYGRGRGVEGLSALHDEIFQREDISFIHLKREDKLARLLSNALAVESGKFLNGKYPSGSITVSPEWAMAELEQMEYWENTFDNLLPPERTYSLSYEDLLADRENQTKEIFEFLGAEPCYVETKMKKQSSMPHREKITNYAALEEYFVGTRFENIFS